ncbi:hypothetical protein [Vibrio diazotrophicus]|uniref:hypothetical protein n=1 Tax=Vibrio diazotrophicus TaxID=685 RepID=UPI00142E515D|nr:hypothetical protein [Vibrio diazotrophicus]NIY94289.1 hypothetical protein [Vibrio diazotrophicus]
MPNTLRIPVQPINTNQRILDNQLDQILALIEQKEKSLVKLTKHHAKFDQVILDAVAGKEITSIQLKAAQVAIARIEELAKSIKEDKEVVLALEAIKEQSQPEEDQPRKPMNLPPLKR